MQICIINDEKFSYIKNSIFLVKFLYYFKQINYYGQISCKLKVSMSIGGIEIELTWQKADIHLGWDSKIIHNLPFDGLAIC